MAHIYGHSWPVRWGSVGEEKLVEVYSNCDQAELFVNEKSYGVKKRNSQDYPAAGLRWNVVFNEGKNSVRVVAIKNKVEVSDEISLEYQTKNWNQPSKFQLKKTGGNNGIETIQAVLVDNNNIPCLDAVSKVQFKISGDGSLIENQGTSTGSSSVQLSNGRATIKLNTNKGKSVVSVSSEGLSTAFIEIE
jgi:beta-galactosidase